MYISEQLGTERGTRRTRGEFAMAFRYQVVSVGMWRGKVKRWNTTFHLANSDQTANLYARMADSGYKAPGDVVGACSGGVASIAVYNATGGAPLSNTIFFDWQTPSTWIPYTAAAWNSVPAGTPLDAAGESAVLISGLMPALSKTGKPVRTRKYLHAVPSRTSAAFDDPDVPAAVVTQLGLLFSVGFMGNAAGVIPNSVQVDDWYVSHQRVRGRRRPVAALQRQAYSNGVITGTAGGAALAQQGAAPFPGE